MVVAVGCPGVVVVVVGCAVAIVIAQKLNIKPRALMIKSPKPRRLFHKSSLNPAGYSSPRICFAVLRFPTLFPHHLNSTVEGSGASKRYHHTYRASFQHPEREIMATPSGRRDSAGTLDGAPVVPKVPIPRLRRASKPRNEVPGGSSGGSLADSKHRVSHACEPCRQRKTKVCIYSLNTARKPVWKIYFPISHRNDEQRH
jgi:hypothetical protein